MNDATTFTPTRLRAMADALRFLADVLDAEERRRMSEADRARHRERLAEEGVEIRCPACGQVRLVLPRDAGPALCKPCRRNRPVIEPAGPEVGR